MKTAHVLLTRFNLATPGRETALRQSQYWLAGRFDLFDRYCLPSIAAQDSHEFDWLIFFDILTPDWARTRIEAGRRIFPFTPIFTELFPGEGWARQVRAAIGPADAGRIVITSNLDNDDGLARDYMRRVRQAAVANWHGQTFAVNVPDGYVVGDGSLYLHHHRFNAFTNLVEADSDAMRTTKTIRHMDLPGLMPIVQAPGGPGWLQVVHGGNVSNKIRGARIARPQRDDFPPATLDDVAPVGAGQLFVDNRIRYPIRAFRDMGARWYRKLFPADRPKPTA